MIALVAALAIGQASAWSPIVTTTPVPARIDFACWKPALLPPPVPFPNLGNRVARLPIVPVYRPPPVLFYQSGVCVSCRRGR